MSSLREVKDRIASVRSTLKITSAMKLVASSKLRKAQRAIEALRPYEQALSDILSRIPPVPAQTPAPPEEPVFADPGAPAPGRTVVLALSSNTSMCGAFNSNVIKLALRTVQECKGPVEVWAFGRKMADALRKAGLPAVRDYSALSAHPTSEESDRIASELRDMFESGQVSQVLLVYNHFVNAGRQTPVCERYLPYSAERGEASPEADPAYFIYEPGAAELAAALVPQILDLKLFAALLDSNAAEHAARMVAMQAATDNGEELLASLTLEYNKGRQQKITSEILDLVSGGLES